MRRTNGTGSVVKLKNKTKHTGEIVESRYWYILYYQHGRQIRESSKSESKMVAEKLLQRRLGECGLGMRPHQDVKNVRYENLRDSLIADYRNKGRTSLLVHKDGSEYIGGVNHLDAFFKGYRAIDITTDVIREYIDSRREVGVPDPTIRRYLVVLRSMLNLAHKEGKLRLADIPYFSMPVDSAPRQGFLRPEIFRQLLALFPKNLRPLVLFLYYTGCRVGAAKQITWSMVNRECTEIEIPPHLMKNREPLTLPLTGKGLDEVSAALKKMFRMEGPVFDATNLRKEWDTACHKLGLGVLSKKESEKGSYYTYKGLTIHDLRRSAARNLIRAGVSRGVAMAITGHKTESVFERYNITDTSDVRDALIKVGQYAKIQERVARKIALMQK